MRTALFAIALLLLASVAHAQTPRQVPADSKWLHAAIAGVGVSAFGDVYSTGVAIGGGAHEANPALAWSVRSPLGLGVIKGGIAVGQVEGLIWIHRRSKLAAYLLCAGATSINIWAIKHNAGVIRR